MSCLTTDDMFAIMSQCQLLDRMLPQYAATCVRNPTPNNRTNVILLKFWKWWLGMTFSGAFEAFATTDFITCDQYFF